MLKRVPFDQYYQELKDEVALKGANKAVSERGTKILETINPLVGYAVWGEVAEYLYEIWHIVQIVEDNKNEDN